MPNPKTGKIATSQRELAELFHCQIKTINTWVGEWKKVDGCPNATKHYDVNWTARWILQRHQTKPKIRKAACEILGIQYTDPQSSSQGNGDGLDVLTELKRAQLRKEQAAAEAQELKNQALRMDVVPAEVVQQSLTMLFTNIRATVKSVPNKIEMSFPAKHRLELRQLLEQHLEHTLESIHSYVTEAEVDIANPSDA